MLEDDALALAAGDAVIGVGRLARAIHNAAHHGNRDVPRLIAQPRLDRLRRSDEIILRPPARGAGNELHTGAQPQRTQKLRARVRFFLRRIGKGDADRVADAVEQQRADARGGFQNAALLRPGLRDADVQRIVAQRGEQSVGLHGHGNVARLDADADVLKAAVFKKLHMAERALAERFGAKTVFFQQPLFHRAGVYADADGNAVLAAGVCHHANPIRRADVAGVDADLIKARLHRSEGQPAIKVNIRHKRQLGAAPDVRQSARSERIRHGKAHDLAARRLQPPELRECGRNIVRVRVRHRLHGNGVPAADGHAADMDGFRYLSVHRRMILTISLYIKSTISPSRSSSPI